MSPIRRRTLALMTWLIAFAASANPAAGEPTIDTLIAGAPVLGAENERLDRFRFTFETPLPFDVPIVATLVWRRHDQCGMLVAVGEERTPVWFLSQKKSLLFDVSKETAALSENAGPGLVVRAEEDSFDLRISMGGEAKHHVAVDLPSFLRDAAANGKLEKESNGDWRLTSLSKSGKSHLIAWFENAEAFPIRRLELRSREDDRLIFAVRDVAINDAVDMTWPAFPAAESLPKGLRLIGSGQPRGDAVADGVEGALHGMRTIAAQAALRHPKWRTLPHLVGVDWLRVQRANEAFGPTLQRLFGAQEVAPPLEKSSCESF